MTSEAVVHVAEIMNRKFVLFPINNEITCILKVMRSSSFKQQWMLILTFRLETLEAGE